MKGKILKKTLLSLLLFAGNCAVHCGGDIEPSTLRALVKGVIANPDEQGIYATLETIFIHKINDMSYPFEKKLALFSELKRYEQIHHLIKKILNETKAISPRIYNQLENAYKNFLTWVNKQSNEITN